MKKTYSFALMAVLVLPVVLIIFIGGSHAEIITVEPASPEVKYCFPFGMGTTQFDPQHMTSWPWTPYGGFIYKNVPAFDLEVGDTIAFDLGAPNDFDIELDIAMAPATENGGTQQAAPFITVVSNTQKPANPRGDADAGNFELQFRAEADFAFAGGGLIIRFSNPSAAYQNDDTCDQVMVCGKPSDTSDYFVKRFYRDTNGTSPWDNESDNGIGAFRIITGDNASTTSSITSSTTSSSTPTSCPDYSMVCGHACCDSDEVCCDSDPSVCCDTDDEACYHIGDIGFCGPILTCSFTYLLSEDSEEVALLRKYRDEVLSKSAVGQEIITLYYLWSPAIVQAMEEDEEFRQEVKELLEQLLPMIEAMVE